MKHIKAPLPFQGQKRGFLKQFKHIVQELPEGSIIVDLFGGSGLLSHAAKEVQPKARVIWNDYDNYAERLANIDRTNVHLAKLRQILTEVPRDQRIPADKQTKLINYLVSESKTGFVDVLTLAAGLVFSGKRALTIDELSKNHLYNRVPLKGYKAENYLNGVERVSTDYKELLKKYQDKPNVVFIADPPYLSTCTKSYKSYWQLKDYLNAMDVVTQQRFIFFTSEKSQMLEFVEWSADRLGAANPFKHARRFENRVNVNHQNSYLDLMLVKAA